jgi:hypothetical protein
MRFLKSFLAENTARKELTKPTKPISELTHSTLKQPTKPTKPGFVSFVSTGTLVSEAFRIFGGRILDPNEVEDHVQEKPKALCIRCRGAIVERVWPDRVDRGCHGCGRMVLARPAERIHAFK